MSAQAAAATQVAVATATRAAAPVWVNVSAMVQGSAVQHNVRLQVSVIVTNRTDASIHLNGSCEHPPIHLEISNPVTSYLWTDTGNFCASSPPFDLQPPVAASSSNTWSYTLDLEKVPGADTQLVPGSYSVLAQIRLWHQGTFDQLSADPTLPHGSASDEKAVRVP